MPNKRRSNITNSNDNTLNDSKYSKRPRRSGVQSNQSEVAQAIIDALIVSETSSGRPVCKQFFKVPSKRGNSVYYEKVKDPIDLNKISQRVKIDEYRDLEILTTDIELMVSNAKMFYTTGSEQFKDACILLDTYYEIKNKLTAEVSTSCTEDAVTKKSTASFEQYDQMREIYETIITETDDDGRVIAELFMKLPDPSSNPTYYEVIKEPIDLDTISDRIENKVYSSWASLKKDVRLLHKNAITYNKNGSQVYNDAITIKRFFDDRISDCEKGKKTVGSVKASARLKTRKSTNYKVTTIKQEIIDEPELHDLTIAAGEDNLQATLFNEVVNYKNLEGLRISDPFGRLPNRRFYPDYYDEIKNPISLRIIKKKINKRHYQALGDLETDLVLLFSNAMQYNESNSNIYHNSVTLKNFVCMRAQTLNEKRPQGKEAKEVKIPKITIKQEVIDKSYNSSRIIENKDDNEESAKKKKRKRKEKSLKTHLLGLFDSVLQTCDTNGRVLTEMFMDKPNRKEWPDYYKRILEPIDMRTIERKIKGDKYPKIEDLLEDFYLMFENARYFNEPGSQIYADANTLQRVLDGQVKEIGPIEANETLLVDTSIIKSTNGAKQDDSNKSLTETSKQEKLWTFVRNYKDVEQRSICVIFEKLPPKNELPEYYKVIRKPMDMERIHNKMQNGQYNKLEEMLQDLLLMFENACTYNEPGSIIYKDALILQKCAVEHFETLEGPQKIPDVKECVHDIICELFVTIVYYKDENKRVLSESLINQNEDCKDARGEEHLTMSLEKIKSNIKQRRYRRLDVFQQHMFELFEDVRTNNRTDSQNYEDVVELQKLFVSTREEICRRGELLISPAHDYTMGVLNNELEKEKKLKQPDELLNDKEVEKSESEIQNKMQRKKSVEDGQEFQGVNLKKGEFVYVEDSKNSSEPYQVVMIEKLYENGEVFGTWFFRPKATFHLPQKKFIKQEVFKTDFQNIISTSVIKGRCHVMNSKDYFQKIPEGMKAENVYVCESYYSPRQKSFKRLKQKDILPPSEHVKLVLRDQPLEREMIQSCFVIGETPELKTNKTDSRESLKKELLAMPKSLGQPIPIYRENVKAETQHPNNKATYYTQFNFNGTWIKLGDCLYVIEPNSTNQRIARVERMWTDGLGNNWFHGTFFINCNLTKHESTRLFYYKELMITSEDGSIRMEQTRGKCEVMAVKEYQASRLTEINEKDVFVCESRYNVHDHTCKKTKMHKTYKHPVKVVEDEICYFKRHIELRLKASELLNNEVAKEVVSREMDLKKSIKASNKFSSPTNSQPQMFPPNYYQQHQSSPYHPRPHIPNVIQTPAKKILMGGQVTPNSRPTSERKRKRGTGHSTGYIIFAAHAHPKVRAENPGLQFGEISRLVGEEWRGLDDKTKKEYEEKAKEQTARAEAEGRLVPKRKKKKKHDDSIIIDDSSVTSTENSRQGALTPSNFPLPPQPMHGQQLVAPVNQMYHASQHQMIAQPSPHHLNQQQVASTYAVPPPPPQQITIAQQAAPVNGIHVRKKGPLFVKPPPKSERILMHSEAYYKYIERVNKGSETIGNWRRELSVQETDVQLKPEDVEKMRVTDWLGKGQGRHPNVKAALWKLRDLMLKDALAIRNKYSVHE